MKLITEHKTTRLIEHAHNKKIYIICNSNQEAHRIKYESEKMGKFILFPLTYDDFIQGRYYARNIDSFVIDNVDMLLEHLSKVPIDIITIRKDACE